MPCVTATLVHTQIRSGFIIAAEPRSFAAAWAIIYAHCAFLVAHHPYALLFTPHSPSVLHDPSSALGSGWAHSPLTTLKSNIQILIVTVGTYALACTYMPPHNVDGIRTGEPVPQRTCAHERMGRTFELLAHAPRTTRTARVVSLWCEFSVIAMRAPMCVCNAHACMLADAAAVCHPLGNYKIGWFILCGIN